MKDRERVRICHPATEVVETDSGANGSWHRYLNSRAILRRVERFSLDRDTACRTGTSSRFLNILRARARFSRLGDAREILPLLPSRLRDGYTVQPACVPIGYPGASVRRLPPLTTPGQTRLPATQGSLPFESFIHRRHRPEPPPSFPVPSPHFTSHHVVPFRYAGRPQE